jgi:hypothetical protein
MTNDASDYCAYEDPSESLMFGGSRNWSALDGQSASRGKHERGGCKACRSDAAMRALETTRHASKSEGKRMVCQCGERAEAHVLQHVKSRREVSRCHGEAQSLVEVVVPRTTAGSWYADLDSPYSKPCLQFLEQPSR